MNLVCESSATGIPWANTWVIQFAKMLKCLPGVDVPTCQLASSCSDLDGQLSCVLAGDGLVQERGFLILSQRRHQCQAPGHQELYRPCHETSR